MRSLPFAGWAIFSRRALGERCDCIRWEVGARGTVLSSEGPPCSQRGIGGRAHRLLGLLIRCPFPCALGRAGRLDSDAHSRWWLFPGLRLRTVVLAEVIQAFSAPENAVRMDEARDNACNDMGKMLQFVLPVATQIQQEVIKAYGFSCDGEGGSDGGRRCTRSRRGRWICWVPEPSSPCSPHGGSHSL